MSSVSTQVKRPPCGVPILYPYLGIRQGEPFWPALRQQPPCRVAKPHPYLEGSPTLCLGDMCSTRCGNSVPQLRMAGCLTCADTDVILASHRQFGDRIRFHGAISAQNVLPLSTAEGVRQHVAEVCQLMKPSGGYILAPDQAITQDMSPANVLVMYEAADEFGNY